MRLQHSIPIALAAISLGGCFSPYVGQGRESDLPCVGNGFFFPMLSTRDSGSSCEPLDKHAETMKYRRRDADDSTKHVLYSEEQRLNLAESSARLMLPFENQQFSLSDYLADKAILEVSKKTECREKYARQKLAFQWQSKLPKDEIYKNIALEWSQRYSDDQLKGINALAKKYGQDTTNYKKTGKELSALVQLQGHISERMLGDESVIKTMNDFWNANKDVLIAAANKVYASTPENHHKCTYRYADHSFLQYEIIEDPAGGGK